MDDDRLRARQELEALLYDYWHDVDTNWGRRAGDFYTDDAVFEGEEAAYRGKAKIQQFYDWRISRGPRLACHSVTNFRCDLQDPGHATCTWYLLLYAADGERILPTHPPITISLVTDTCVKTGGRWLVSYRRFQTLFAGGTPAHNPKLDDE